MYHAMREKESILSNAFALLHDSIGTEVASLFQSPAKGHGLTNHGIPRTTGILRRWIGWFSGL
jgi:hypothetical protein